MSGLFRVESLHSDEFLREIHHLLWRAPFSNNGAPDCGWNCRDHALIVSLLLRHFEIPSCVCFGKLALVTGPNGRERPYGNSVDPHAWNFIPGSGSLDTSIRVPRKIAAWKNWEIEGVFAGAVRGNLPATHLITDSSIAFESGVNAASCEPGGRSLIYQIQGITESEKIPLDDLILWVDSPHSRRMATKFASDRLIYIKAAYHLRMLLEGRRQTLTGVWKTEVWDHISRISDDEVLSSMPKLALSN